MIPLLNQHLRWHCPNTCCASCCLFACRVLSPITEIHQQPPNRTNGWHSGLRPFSKTRCHFRPSNSFTCKACRCDVFPPSDYIWYPQCRIYRTSRDLLDFQYLCSDYLWSSFLHHLLPKFNCLPPEKRADGLPQKGCRLPSKPSTIFFRGIYSLLNFQRG